MKASAVAAAIASLYPGMVRQPYQLAQADASGAATGAAGAGTGTGAGNGTGTGDGTQGTGATGAGNGAASTSSPDVQALITAAVEKEVQGLKGKNADLLQRLGKKDEELKRFEGIDPEATRAMLAKIGDAEEAKLLQDGKYDEAKQLAVTRATQMMQKDHLRALEEKDQLITKEKSRADAFVQRVKENNYRAAAIEAGVLPAAIKYGVIGAADEVFTVDDQGNSVARDGQLGKDGKSPLTLKEWFADLKEKAPHFWPATQGSGAQSSNATGSSKTMKRAAFDALPQRQKDDFIKAQGQVVP